jgi:hypothetical protein
VLNRVALSAALAGAVLFGAASCSDGNAPPPATTARIALVLPQGSTLGWIAYKVFSSTGVVLLAGGESLTDPNATLSVVLKLPAGEGEVVEMSAATSLGDLCSGTSAPFDVVAGVAAEVDVSLICPMSATTADHCPTVASWTAARDSGPATTPAEFDLMVAANDSDPGDLLSFAWTATAGTFGEPASPSTVYSCGPESQPTITLKISDDHAPSACSVSLVLPVICPQPSGSASP